jgi:hypothetical protein
MKYRWRGVMPQLRHEQVAIQSAHIHKLVMRAGLHNPAVVEHEYQGRGKDVGEIVTLALMLEVTEKA